MNALSHWIAIVSVVLSQIVLISWPSLAESPVHESKAIGVVPALSHGSQKSQSFHMHIIYYINI